MQQEPKAHQIAEDLGTLNELWRGWKLRRGQLYDPLSTAVVGWHPSQVRALPYLHAQVNALQIELLQTRDQLLNLEALIGEFGPAHAADKVTRRKKREARQLSNLARQGPSGFAQATERTPRRTTPPTVPPGLIFGPVPGGITRRPVRAIPPGTQRDRK